MTSNEGTVVNDRDRVGPTKAQLHLLGAGHDRMLNWARAVDGERVWAVEDCRHVSGKLERFLLARGEQVVRVPPKLMAGRRRGSRQRGKSDPIDSLAVARAALKEGIETLPIARLQGPAREIKPLLDESGATCSAMTSSRSGPAR